MGHYEGEVREIMVDPNGKRKIWPSRDRRPVYLKFCPGSCSVIDPSDPQKTLSNMVFEMRQDGVVYVEKANMHVNDGIAYRAMVNEFLRKHRGKRVEVNVGNAEINYDDVRHVWLECGFTQEQTWAGHGSQSYRFRNF